VPRRILILANPIAGGGRARNLAPALARELAARGADAEVHFTAAAGDAGRRAGQANEAWDALVVLGGDGTVNEVLNGMPDPTRPLGVLPLGTANVLACELGLPREPAAAAAAFMDGRVRPLAIGLANGRRFLLFCGVGIDGAVAQRLHEARPGTLGKRKWLGPILHVTRRWPRFSLRARLADGEELDGLSAVLVTRVRNYGGVLRLTPGIDVDDGMLHVLCFSGRTRAWWMWQGLRGFLRCMRPGPGLVVRRANAVRIDGAAPLQIDGDYAGQAPVGVELLAARANVLVPR
jgi:diacylglycerol kinase (ATP)